MEKRAIILYISYNKLFPSDKTCTLIDLSDRIDDIVMLSDYLTGSEGYILRGCKTPLLNLFLDPEEVFQLDAREGTDPVLGATLAHGC